MEGAQPHAIINDLLDRRWRVVGNYFNSQAGQPGQNWHHNVKSQTVKRCKVVKLSLSKPRCCDPNVLIIAYVCGVWCMPSCAVYTLLRLVGQLKCNHSARLSCTRLDSIHNVRIKYSSIASLSLSASSFWSSSNAQRARTSAATNTRMTSSARTMFDTRTLVLHSTPRPSSSVSTNLWPHREFPAFKSNQIESTIDIQLHLHLRHQINNIPTLQYIHTAAFIYRIYQQTYVTYS